MDLFSPTGIADWRRRINASDRFADAAAGWSGRLLLVERQSHTTRSSWVVVDHGRCTEARVGTDADADVADYVLAASPTTWHDLVTAASTPAVAALRGHLSLLKGSVLALLPHAHAAAELLAAAAEGNL
jgi:putative sterol carrier protein